MHFLHAILVEASGETPEQMRIEARSDAENAIDCYGNGDVWDWYDDTGAGRWAEVYPNNGVVLGSEPGFLDQLEHWRMSPLKNALDSIQREVYGNTAWRTEEEIAAIPGCEKLGNPLVKLGLAEFVPNDGKFYSGTRIDAPKIDEEFIKAVWDEPYGMKGYSLYKALKLAQGHYCSDSNFYNAVESDCHVSEELVGKVKEHPENYALVFIDMHN